MWDAYSTKNGWWSSTVTNGVMYFNRLPGGCNVTVRFVPGPKVTDEAKAQATGEGLVSSAATVKAVKPVVAEILLGYP